MPDIQLPPNWGPASFDERDLEAVLSGETVDIPVALRPVADTLAALRAAAAPAELSGEATIMAEFRAVAEFRALGLDEPALGAGPAQTLQLPVPPTDLPTRRVARHRGRRRAAPRVSRRAGVLMGAAAAAVIVVTAVFAANLLGPIQRAAHLSTVSPSAGRTAGSDSASPGLQATSAATEHTARPAVSGQASPSPSPSPSPSKPSRLCHKYYDSVKHPGPPSSWAAEISLFQQLSNLAGGPSRISGYCSSYVGDLFPHGTGPSDPHFHGLYSGGQGKTGSGDQQGQGNGAAQPGQGQPTPADGNPWSGQGNPGSGPSPHS